MKKTYVFLGSFVLLFPLLFYPTVFFMTAMMPLEEVREYPAAIFGLTSIIAILSAFIVVLLSYHSELRDLRDFRDFFALNAGSKGFEQLTEADLRPKAAHARDTALAEIALLRDGYQAVYGKVTRGSEIEAFFKKADELKYATNSAKRVFEDRWDMVRRIMHRVSPNAKLYARAYNNWLQPVLKTEEEKRAS